MHQSFVATVPATYGDGGGYSGDNVQAVIFWVPPQWRACDIMQIYPRCIYYYKEWGYDSQQVPAVQSPL